MKKILIAVDYAPSAQKVAEQGYSLGKALNAEIILLHAIADAVYYSSSQYSPIMGFGGFSTTDMMPVEDANVLYKASLGFLQSTVTHLGDESIQIMTEVGEPAAAILKVAAEKGADIIVIGSHGRSGLSKILLGSVAEEVLHHSTVPLFIVPTKE